MATYKTYESLMAGLTDTIVKPAVMLTAENVKKTLKNNLSSLWYNTSNPQEYIRTYDIIKSISVSEIKKNGKTSYEAKVFFDDNLIMQIPSLGGDWSSHMGMPTIGNSKSGAVEYGGLSISQWVPIWLDQGQNSSIYSYDGVEYVKATMDDVKKIMEKTKQDLRKLGLNVI